MRFRPEQHLRRQADFKHVRERGRRYDAGAFVVFWVRRRSIESNLSGPGDDGGGPEVGCAFASSAESERGPARVGFVASRAAVGNAVLRSRAKRRLREAFRLHQTLFPAGYDFIFQARRSLNQLEYATLREKFLAFCRQLSRIP